MGKQLKPGQVWMKNGRERTIVQFDKVHMYYKTKKDIKEGTMTCVLRSTFRNWLTARDNRATLLKESVK
jgi:hypothetical protein